MNIVLYTNSFLPQTGGREIVVHYLAKELKRLGHNVRILGPAGWLKERRYKFGYPVHRWPTLRGLFPEKVSLVQFILDIGIWGCDIIHAHSTYPCGYIAAKGLGRKKVPIVVTPHGEDIHVARKIGFGLRLDPVLNGKITEALMRSQIATAISKSVQDSILSTGITGNKIRLIPNGIDVDRFKINHPGVYSWLDIPETSKLILTVGNYHPRKGHEDLIKAMPYILDDIPDARCVIVGRNTEQLTPLIKTMALQGHVKLTGLLKFPVGDINGRGKSNKIDKIASLYQHSAVYVSAAKDEGAEGLSLAMLDAMAAGLPIAATRVSGNKDLINDGINGLLVSPGKPKELAIAIKKCLLNKKMAQEFGQRGNGKAEEFSWQNIAHRYVDVYREAIYMARNIN